MISALHLAVIGTLSFVAAHPVNQEMVDFIKQSNATWTPVEVSENVFANFTEQELRSLIGSTILNSEEIPIYSPRRNLAIPSSFDSRTQWAGCIHAIRNQGQCNSGWAFASSGFLSDRFCIASQGSINVTLSPQDMISCDTNNYGCEQDLNINLNYLEVTGLVKDSCMPYLSANGQIPACSSSCANSVPIKKYKCKVGSTILANTTSTIQNLIFTSGPVQANLNVYEDFLNYQSGVYTHVSGQLIDYQSVKIIGWGTESGLNFWLAANSWGTSWGQQGFFKIKQGNSGINSAVACIPDLLSAA